VHERALHKNICMCVKSYTYTRTQAKVMHKQTNIHTCTQTHKHIHTNKHIHTHKSALALRAGSSPSQAASHTLRNASEKTDLPAPGGPETDSESESDAGSESESESGV
jgi:hypothetical protein